MSTSPIAITRALHSALEAGKHGADLRRFFTDDATAVEHPNLVRPKGGHAGLEQIIAASSAGAGLLASQHYDLHSAVEVGSLAVLRLTWTGIVKGPSGAFVEGQALRAHLAQFIDTRDGKVLRIETFDCYEPFTQVAAVRGYG